MTGRRKKLPTRRAERRSRRRSGSALLRRSRSETTTWDTARRLLGSAEDCSSTLSSTWPRPTSWRWSTALVGAGAAIGAGRHCLRHRGRRGSRPSGRSLWSPLAAMGPRHCQRQSQHPGRATHRIQGDARLGHRRLATRGAFGMTWRASDLPVAPRSGDGSDSSGSYHRSAR